MLLSINQSKVAKLLKESDNSYVAIGLNISPTVEHEPSAAGTSIGGIAYRALPSLVTDEATAYLRELRRQIEESGTRLKTVDELELEIEEARGSRRNSK